MYDIILKEKGGYVMRSFGLFVLEAALASLFGGLAMKFNSPFCLGFAIYSGLFAIFNAQKN